ncbi:TIGR04372 family glycosyltransferase [Pseudocolwellia agarivorans]|uniref:TIGR04372 family glycosyltransferase n=1 Tax=Pseudocolwellia agarivorans TaxID=1911682 RepID=UPI0009841169|nr:TIGR04372 family glycosyltransferase [Pseudocolwellia agarivorans]
MQKSPSIQQLVEHVRIHQEMGKYDTLLPVINTLLKKDPNNSEYLLWKLQVLDAQQEEILDFNLLHHYVNMRSSDVTGYLLLYKAYMSKNMVADALIALAYALSVEPDDEECQYLFNKTLADINPKYTRLKLNILTTNRIGHLAIEIEPWLRDQENKVSDDNCLYLFISSGKPPANTALYNLLKNYVHIIESSIWFNFYITRAQLLDEQFFIQFSYDIHSILRGNTNEEIAANGSQALIRIYNENPSVLQLAPDDITQGWSLLSQYGLSKSDKIVCLHVRDSDYLNKLSSDTDFSYHNYRDVNIAHYQKAVESLIDKGYKVVRIGNGSNQKLNILSENYLDFCLDRDKEHGDFFELLLISQCSFYIGALSGPISVVALFDTPTLCVNSVPFNPPYLRSCRFIPKHLFHNNEKVNVIDVYEGKVLSEQDDTPLLFCSDGNKLSKYGYHYVENTAEEILLAVNEFEKQIVDGEFLNEVTPLQKKYTERIQNLPTDFIFKDSSSLVCDSFLSQYPELF